MRGLNKYILKLKTERKRTVGWQRCTELLAEKLFFVRGFHNKLGKSIKAFTFITHNTDWFEPCYLNRSIPSATLELDFFKGLQS